MTRLRRINYLWFIFLWGCIGAWAYGPGDSGAFTGAGVLNADSHHAYDAKVTFVQLQPITKAQGNSFYFDYDEDRLANAWAKAGGNYGYADVAILIQPVSAPETELRYEREERSGKAGMYYLRARYYKPDLGRFWTMDTFEGKQGDPLSLHKYVYCRADPVGRTDPSGHMDFNFISLLSSMTTMEGLQGLKAGVDAKIKWEMRAFQQELLTDLSPSDLKRNEVIGYEGEEVWVRYLNSIGFRAIRAKGPVSAVGPDVYAARVKGGRLEIMIGEVKASKKGFASVVSH